MMQQIMNKYANQKAMYKSIQSEMKGYDGSITIQEVKTPTAEDPLCLDEKYDYKYNIHFSNNLVDWIGFDDVQYGIVKASYGAIFKIENLESSIMLETLLKICLRINQVNAKFQY